MVSPVESDPQRTRMEQVVEAQAAAWVALDADAVARSFADPCEFIVPGAKLTRPEEIRESAAEFFTRCAEVRIKVTGILVDGTRAAISWSWYQRDADTNEISEAEDAILVRVEGEKISYWREYIDGTGAGMMQMVKR